MADLESEHSLKGSIWEEVFFFLNSFIQLGKPTKKKSNLG